jgi:Ca-activated chloride channel homolog
MSESLLQVKVRSSRRTLARSDTGQVLYLLVDLAPPGEVETSRVPLNLALVVDSSTSMGGERLDRVRWAIEGVLDTLGEEDLLTLVSFSDRAEILIPLAPVTSKRRIMNRVNGIFASGGTEVYQGLLAANHELSQAPLEEHVNRIVLLTDGRTYGDEEQCLALAEAAAQKGMGITALGIGNDWNEQLLDALVAPSGGQSAYLDDPSEMVARIEGYIQELSDAYATRVRLMDAYQGSTRLKTVFRVAPHVQPLSVRDGASQLGIVSLGSRLSVLLELGLDPHLPEDELVIPLSVTFDVPGLGQNNRTLRRRFRLPIVSERLDEEPPEALLAAVRLLNFHRMIQRTWEDYEKGRPEQAERRLRHLTGRLVEAGYGKLARRLEDETRQLSIAGALSLEGRKQLTFGTRRLTPPTGSLDETP